MPVYSNSKLSSFEKCPLQFQFRYIDRIPTDVESVEAFMGKRVHEALDWLYQEVGEGRVPTVEDMNAWYNALWHQSWHRLISTVRKKKLPDDYRKRGLRCLETYYRGNWPFNADRTLARETEVVFALDDDTLFRGFIDRVSRGPNGELVIHDYKTSGTMPRRMQMLTDLQPAIYQMGATERWPGASTILLVWHYLTFAKKITIQLNRAIEDRRRILMRRVETIEAAVEREELPAKESVLCDWCSYRLICPAKNGSRDRALDLLLDPSTALSRMSELERRENAGQIKLI